MGLRQRLYKGAISLCPAKFLLGHSRLIKIWPLDSILLPVIGVGWAGFSLMVFAEADAAAWYSCEVLIDMVDSLANVRHSALVH